VEEGGKRDGGKLTQSGGVGGGGVRGGRGELGEGGSLGGSVSGLVKVGVLGVVWGGGEGEGVWEG